MAMLNVKEIELLQDQLKKYDTCLEDTHEDRDQQPAANLRDTNTAVAAGDMPPGTTLSAELEPFFNKNKTVTEQISSFFQEDMIEINAPEAVTPNNHVESAISTSTTDIPTVPVSKLTIIPEVVSRRLYVSGFPPAITEEEFSNRFEAYGEVTYVEIDRDESRLNIDESCGFVTFKDLATAQIVLADVQNINFGGNLVHICEATAKKTQVFVGGLHPNVDSDMMREHFSTLGEVCDAIVKVDARTGASRCFGFVTFLDCDHVVNRLCDLRFIDCFGKKIEIKRATPISQYFRGLKGEDRNHHGDGNNYNRNGNSNNSNRSNRNNDDRHRRSSNRRYNNDDSCDWDDHNNNTTSYREGNNNSRDRYHNTTNNNSGSSHASDRYRSERGSNNSNGRRRSFDGSQHRGHNNDDSSSNNANSNYYHGRDNYQNNNGNVQHDNNSTYSQSTAASTNLMASAAANPYAQYPLYAQPQQQQHPGMNSLAQFQFLSANPQHQQQLFQAQMQQMQQIQLQMQQLQAQSALENPNGLNNAQALNNMYASALSTPAIDLMNYQFQTLAMDNNNQMKAQTDSMDDNSTLLGNTVFANSTYMDKSYFQTDDGTYKFDNIQPGPINTDSTLSCEAVNQEDPVISPFIYT